MLGIGKSTVSIMLAGDPEGKVSEEMWREVEPCRDWGLQGDHPSNAGRADGGRLYLDSR